MAAHNETSLADSVPMPAQTSAVVQEHMRPYVLVMGMHRSGTSLCSSVVHRLGIDMVVTNDPGAPTNETGHWERLDIVHPHDKILRAFHQTWNSLTALPVTWWRDPLITAFKDNLAACLPESGSSSCWGFKDPRTTRLLPMWKELLDRRGIPYKIILCLRNPRNVAESLAKRNEFSINYGKLLWLRHYTDFFHNIADDDFLVIEYDKWFTEPKSNIEAMINFLGLDRTIPKSSVDEILSASIKRNLYHNQFALDNDYCSSLYSKIIQSATCGDTRKELIGLLANAEAIGDYHTEMYKDAEAYKTSKKTLDACQAERNDLAAQVKTLRDENATLRNTLETAETQRDDAVADRQELMASSDEEKRQIALLHKALEAAQMEQATAAADLQALLSARGREKQQADALRQLLDTTQAACDKAIAERQALAERLEQQEALLKQVRLELADLSRQVQEMANQAQLLAQERRALMENVIALYRNRGTQGLTPLHFNEAYYLLRNSDVKQAVEVRLLQSGLEHWLEYGFAEDRSVLFTAIDPAVMESLIV